MTDAVLSADSVEFSYGQLQVLFGVSLSVREGEALALLGTNGAGKSTLLRVIAGLETPSSGTVTLAGADITGERAETLIDRGLALIPGGRAVFNEMTVDENLRMMAFSLRKDRAEVARRRAQVLEIFPRLAERPKQVVGTLSGGEQQQLALAKAMILNPKVLCIDELSLGLAPVVVAELLAIVQQINQSGVAVVLVEQSLNVAAQLCDQAVFLEKGAVKFQGNTRDLLDRDDIARAVFLGAHGPDPRRPHATAPRGSRLRGTRRSL